MINNVDDALNVFSDMIADIKDLSNMANEMNATQKQTIDALKAAKDEIQSLPSAERADTIQEALLMEAQNIDNGFVVVLNNNGVKVALKPYTSALTADPDVNFDDLMAEDMWTDDIDYAEIFDTEAEAQAIANRISKAIFKRRGNTPFRTDDITVELLTSSNMLDILG